MKITIIGAGNMGGSIARGLAKGSLINAKDITITAKTEKTLDQLKKLYPKFHTTTDNTEAVKGAELIIVAVKPWLIDSVAKEICKSLNPKNQIVASVVAGVPFEHLETIFQVQEKTPVLFRLIPNTAISVLQSMTVISAYKASEAQIETITGIFNELGKTIVIEERLMTAATALCSCGTAYALRYIRAAMEGGVEMGLYPEQAKFIASQTVKGAAELLLAHNAHPEAEIDKVTTPGGITIKGLNEMESAGFSSAVIRGLKASK